MSQFFASGGQSIGVSASTSVLPMTIQDWSSLGWTGWISLQSKGLSSVTTWGKWTIESQVNEVEKSKVIPRRFNLNNGNILICLFSCPFLQWLNYRLFFFFFFWVKIVMVSTHSQVKEGIEAHSPLCLPVLLRSLHPMLADEGLGVFVAPVARPRCGLLYP